MSINPKHPVPEAEEAGAIAICQHPNGEGVWWPLGPNEDGSACIQDCDCSPLVYVPIGLSASQEEGERHG